MLLYIVLCMLNCNIGLNIELHAVPADTVASFPISVSVRDLFSTSTTTFQPISFIATIFHLQFPSFHSENSMSYGRHKHSFELESF